MPRDSRTRQQLRSRVAAAAARLIAEDGVLDYSFAKRKAARQLGMEGLHVLPDNDQIEEALRVHQSLYEPDEQQARVRYLREEALRAMQMFAVFRPYLRGSVLKGTASRYNGIELQLFVEDSKELELFLLNRNIRFEVIQSRGHGQERGVPVFRMDWEDIPLSLAVHPLNDERNTTGAGRPADRASAAALQQLLDAESSSAGGAAAAGDST